MKQATIFLPFDSLGFDVCFMPTEANRCSLQGWHRSEGFSKLGCVLCGSFFCRNNRCSFFSVYLVYTIIVCKNALFLYEYLKRKCYNYFIFSLRVSFLYKFLFKTKNIFSYDTVGPYQNIVVKFIESVTDWMSHTKNPVISRDIAGCI